jgi:hypothetical protein
MSKPERLKMSFNGWNSFRYSSIVCSFTCVEVFRFAGWLRLVGYVETTRNINSVHRQFMRREGLMLPGELIRYMDRLVAQTLLSQQKAATSRSASSVAATM